MEKSDKKRILTRVLIVIAALTLLSCCFLGSTFARYVTSADGSAQVNVAKWDLSMTANGNTAVVVGGDDAKLSPDVADFADGNRIHKHAGALAMTIRNNGDVAADVDVTFSVKGYQDTNGSWFTGWSTSGIENDEDVPSETEATSTLKIQVAVTTSSTLPAADASDWKDYGTVSVNNVAAKGGVVYVYIRAVWDTMDDLGEATSDKIDTWLGENISAVVADISYSAVQASELPTVQP